MGSWASVSLPPFSWVTTGQPYREARAITNGSARPWPGPVFTRCLWSARIAVTSRSTSLVAGNDHPVFASLHPVVQAVVLSLQFRQHFVRGLQAAIVHQSRHVVPQRWERVRWVLLHPRLDQRGRCRTRSRRSLPDAQFPLKFRQVLELQAQQARKRGRGDRLPLIRLQQQADVRPAAYRGPSSGRAAAHRPLLTHAAALVRPPDAGRRRPDTPVASPGRTSSLPGAESRGDVARLPG